MEERDYTEPLFVYAIMMVAASKAGLYALDGLARRWPWSALGRLAGALLPAAIAASAVALP